jgi:hypothetical protein
MFGIHKWRCNCASEHRAARRVLHLSPWRKTLKFKPARHSFVLEKRGNILKNLDSSPASTVPAILDAKVDRQSSSSVVANNEFSVPPALHHGWLFNNKAAEILDLETRKTYSQLVRTPCLHQRHNHIPKPYCNS